MMELQAGAIPIVPSSDLDASQAFYERLGFTLTSDFPVHGYRILHDAAGASIHLTKVDAGWTDPDRNAHGVYLYSRSVDVLADEFGSVADAKPWGLREFAICDPDGTLVRVGWRD